MKRILIILLLVTVLFVGVGFAQWIPMWSGKKIIITSDTLSISCHFIPDDTKLRDLGSSISYWRKGYIDSLWVTYLSGTVSRADSLLYGGTYYHGDSFLVVFGDTFQWLQGDSINLNVLFMDNMGDSVWLYPDKFIMFNDSASQRDSIYWDTNRMTWKYHTIDGGMIPSVVSRVVHDVNMSALRDSFNINMVIGRRDSSAGISHFWSPCTILIWTNVDASVGSPQHPGFYRIYTKSDQSVDCATTHKGALYIDSPNITDETQDVYGEIILQARHLTLDAFGWRNSPLDKYGKIYMFIGSGTDTTAYFSMGGGIPEIKIETRSNFTTRLIQGALNQDTLVWRLYSPGGVSQMMITKDTAGVNLDTTFIRGGVIHAKDSVITEYLNVITGTDTTKITGTAFEGDSVFGDYIWSEVGSDTVALNYFADTILYVGCNDEFGICVSNISASTDPSYGLYVYSMNPNDKAYGGYFYTDSGHTNYSITGLYGKAKGGHSQATDVIGIEGYAEVEAGATSPQYAGKFTAAGCGAGKKYGLWASSNASAVGGDSAFGIWAKVGRSAEDGKPLFGGYFRAEADGAGNDTTYGLYVLAKWGAVNFGAVVNPNVYVITGTDTTKIDENGIYSTSSPWWYCKYMDAINLSAGGSGAVQTMPGANTIGGYQMDAATEYLYFNGGVCNNWDSISDLVVKVRYEVNIDNSAGGVNDTVELGLLCYYKGNGETTNKTQTVSSRVEVGQSPQFKQFTAEFTIDYDLVANVVQKDDVLAMRLNLDTVNSDVDNIIINFARFKYKQKVPQPITY